MGSFLKRLGASLTRLISSKELVGRDIHGNKYFRWPEKDLHGELVEKRAIETPDARYDPNLVPPEWLQWLKQTRRAPPSPEEILQMEARRQAIRHRAAALEAAEAQRRFQEATLGQRGDQAGGPNMDRFVQQLTGRGYAADGETGEDQGQPAQSRQGTSSGQQTGPSEQGPSDQGKDQFHADVWKPGA